MAYKLTPYDRRVQAQLIRAEREARYLKNKPFAQRVAKADTKKKSEASGATKALHTAGDVAANLVTGAAKGLEGIWDLGAGLVGAVGGLFSDKFEDNVKAHVAKDHVGEWFGNAWQEGLDQSLLNDSTVGGIIEGVAQGVGQMLPAVAVTLIPGVGPALGAKLALGTTMASAAGTGTEQAFGDGAGYGQGLAYGAASGAIEGVTEKLLPGAGDLYGKALTKMGKRAVKEVGAEVAEVGIKRAAKEALGEGAEEVLSELANPALKSIYKGRDALKEYGDSEYWKGVAEAGIVGMGTSAAYGGTVGRMTKTTGKYADARATLEHIEEQQKLRSRADLTQAERVQIEQNIKADNEQFSNRLRKLSDKGRAAVFEKMPQLKLVFDADGSINETQRAALDANIKAAGDSTFDVRYRTSTLSADTIENVLRKANAKGVNVRAFKGELSEVQSKKNAELHTLMGTIGQKSSGKVKYFLAENVGENGFFDPDTGVVVIDVSTLESGDATEQIVKGEIASELWQQTAIHETGHATEGQASNVALVDHLVSNDSVYTQAVSDFIERGYFGENVDAAEQKLKTLIEKVKNGTELTESEQKDLDTARSEIAQIATENVLGNADFVKRLIKGEPSRAEKILGKIVQIKNALSGEVGRASNKEIAFVQKAERLYLNAIVELGGTYQGGKIHLANREEDELTREISENMHVSGGNVAESVDESSELRYNKRELYTATGAFHKEVVAEDQHAFARSLANKTAGFAKGQVKTIEIYGAKNIYWFKADGYMHGTMLRSVDADDDTGYDNARREFENGINSDSEVANLWANFVPAKRTGAKSDISHTRNGRRKGNADLVLEGKRERNRTGDQGSGYTDYRIDNDEVERIIKGLREMLAKTDEESENRDALLDGEGEVRYNDSEIQFAKKAKYIPYDKIGKANIAFLRNELRKLYFGISDGVADSIAIAQDSTIYIVDSGKDNGEISFGVRRKIKISDKTNRSNFVRRANNDAVRNGHISDGLLGKFGAQLDSDRGRDMRRESGTELSANQGKSRDNQGGVSVRDENRGGIKFSRKAAAFTHRDVNEMLSTVRGEALTFTLEDGTEIKGEISRRDGFDLEKWLYDTLNGSNSKDKRVLAREIADRILDVATTDTDGEQLVREAIGEDASALVREDLALSVSAALGDKQAQIENKRKNAHFDTMRKLAEEMRDVEKGRFYSATVYDGDTLRAIPNMLRAALKTSRAFTGSIRNTLAKVKDWYCAEDNAMMYKAVNDEHNEGMANGQVVFDKDIAAMLEELTTGTGALSAQELEMVVDIAKHFQKLSERYQRVFINGKWVDAEQLAEEMVSIMQSAKKDQNWLVHGIVSKYMRQFGDPAALFRAMDGYDRNGFYTKMHEWMRNAAISMQADELHALKEYYEWHKKHKKWAKHLGNDLIEFRGEKMTVGQLMTLYCESKTEKSKQGLADNGFKFTDKDGKPHRIKGLIYEQGKGEKASRKHKRADVERACKQLENEIWSMLSEYQRAYIKLLENVLNTTCRTWKINTDTLMKGFSRVHERGYYFPSAHNGIAKTVDTTFYEGDRVGHLSLNKEAVEGARGELIIDGIDNVVLRHVHNMALYKNYAIVAENRSMLQNIDVGRVDGKGERVKNVHQPVTIRTTNEEYGKQRGTDMMKLLDKMSKDLQGGRRAGQDEQSFLKDLVEQIRGNYARFQLGLNPKTLATQLSSLIAAGNILEYNCIVRGIKGFGSKEAALLVDKYCPLAELRNFDNSAALAAGVLETTGKVGDVLMKGIGFVDRRVICSLFYACQLQVEKDSKLALGTEENLKAAGELLTRVILETQQNSLVTEKSDAMRGGIFSRTFTMFTADGMKVIGRWFDALGEWAVIKRRLQNAKTDADKARLQKELKRAQGQAARSTAALVGQAIYMALISYIFRLLYDKDEEKVGDNVLQGAWDFAGGLIGGLPIARDVYSYFTDGYELDNFFLSTINDVLVATKDSFNVATDALSGKDVSRQDVFGSVRKVTYAAGQMFGIPVRNAYNFATGLTRRFVPTAGYTVDSLFASKAYSTDLAKAIENEDERMVETIAGLMIDEKIGIEDDKMRDVLRNLAGAGYSVLPRSVGDSVTVNGEEHTLTGRQQKRLRTVYAVGEEAVADMCRLKQFAEADDEVQAKAIQFIYGVYWDLAVEDVLGVELAEKNVLFAEAIDIEKLAIIIAQARSLEADKDKDGKAIAGTKKRKVERFVASLRLTAAQKYMVMGYLGYTNANGRAQVESYIGGLKLTKTEKAALLKYSGYAA